jgi:hypothetical protein
MNDVDGSLEKVKRQYQVKKEGVRPRNDPANKRIDALARGAYPVSDFVPLNESGRPRATWASLANTVIDVLRPLMKRRYLVPVLIFLVFSGMLTSLKVIRLDQQYGDSALYFQLTDNLASRGVPLSSVYAAIDDFHIQGIPSATAEQISTNPLSPNQPVESNYFLFHAHYILYPIAVLTKVIPTNVVLLSLFVLSFTGLVLLAYFILRAKAIPIGAACLFCLLIISHPAWSDAFNWQFYPERLFVLAGFVFMYLVSREKTGRSALIAAGVVCALIIERTGIMAGAFLLLYVLLYWRSGIRDRTFKLGFGAALLFYGIFILKFGVTNPEYANFLPSSFAALMWNLHYPHFLQNLGMFGLVNCVLLIVALFEWRAAVIAVVFMLPNALGNLGGSEKVAWSTHYHDIYLPALVWAALVGFIAAYRMAAASKRLPVFYALTCLLILFLSCIDPYSAANLSISPSNLQSHFLARFVRESNEYLGMAGRSLDASYGDLQRAVPEHTVVSVPEGVMTALYPNRTLRFFPMDIDHADYAVLSILGGVGNDTEYGGIISYRGPDEALRIDKVIVARMKRDGYDFAHAAVIPGMDVAVVKRLHAGERP